MPDNEVTTVTRPAAGRVRTGFSNVFVALFALQNGSAVYSDGVQLGRARKISVSATVADGNDYYAEDQLSEVGSNTFVKGTAAVTVDGAWTEVRKKVMGLSRTKTVTIGSGQTAQTVTMTAYGDDQQIPYMGIGYVEQYMSAGNTFYVVKVLTKVRFKAGNESAETREEKINWQDEEMNMDVMRDGTAQNDFKYESEELTSLEAAIAVVKAVLNIA